MRKSVYNVDESKRDKMPAKINTGVLEDHIDYCNKLVTVIKNDETLISIPNVVEQVNLLEEMVSDNTAELKLSYDHDAKVGHKTYDTHFFGYKTHIAMTEDRIITAAVVTTGEKHDGKQLISLIEKTQSAGMEVNEVIGDGAYSESDNLVYGKQNNITIVAKLSKCVTHGNGHNSEEFEYNKDADMYVCKDGHMAIRKAKGNVKAKGRLYPYTSYFFDTEKCKRCPHKDGCYTEGAKSKTYTVSHKQGNQLEQKEFMESDYFKERSKIRYMIEAKNSELKNGHDMSTTYTAGLLGMNIQAATTIFVVNLKRIIALKG